MVSLCCPPHLDTMLGGPAHRHEVRHDVGNQVSAHLHSGVEVILQQIAWQLDSFQLRNTSERNGKKRGQLNTEYGELGPLKIS